MIYKASHHPVIYPFFKLYSLMKIKRHFHKVTASGDFTEKELPILLISNHISWWDGFWAMYINLKLLHRKFYFMMSEEELRKHMFFNKTGGYSVRKGSRSVIETLDYTLELLHGKNNLVLVFPQGRIESVHNHTIHFEKGIEHILKKVTWNIQIIFLVNLVDYFSNPRPGLYMYYREYNQSDAADKNIQAEFNRFHSECIAETIKQADS